MGVAGIGETDVLVPDATVSEAAHIVRDGRRSYGAAGRARKAREATTIQ
jgi:hypothetical protein